MMPRLCQPCTACCDGWLQITVDDQPVYPGRPCPHSTGHSCRIFERRPEDPCRQFVCAWLSPHSHLPEEFRPDLARVIVLADVRRWQGRPVDVAVPVGRRIPGKTLAWLKDYSRLHGRPLIYLEQADKRLKYSREQVAQAFGPPDFQAGMLARIESGAKLW